MKYLSRLYHYKGDLLSSIGKKYYNNFIEQLKKSEIKLTALDVNLIETLSLHYQKIKEIENKCGGSVEDYIVENGLSTQAAVVSLYRYHTDQYKDLLSHFPTSPKLRSKLNTPEPEEKDASLQDLFKK